MTPHEIVNTWMTRPVHHISSGTALPEIHSKMREYHVRRMPVIDHDKLVGIVTLNDVLAAKPSAATSLSVHELGFMVSQVTAKQLMSSPVITVTPSTTVGEVAQLMLDHKIGGIPVMDDHKLVGMITESDIFRMLVHRGI